MATSRNHYIGEANNLDASRAKFSRVYGPALSIENVGRQRQLQHLYEQGRRESRIRLMEQPGDISLDLDGGHYETPGKHH